MNTASDEAKERAANANQHLPDGRYTFDYHGRPIIVTQHTNPEDPTTRYVIVRGFPQIAFTVHREITDTVREADVAILTNGVPKTQQETLRKHLYQHGFSGEIQFH